MLKDLMRKGIKKSGAALSERGLLTSFRAFSSLGLLSSTVSLDCCFSFLSSAVTETHKRTRDEAKHQSDQKHQ